MNPHSTHTFLCPLRWDYLPKGYHPNDGKESLSFDDRTALNRLLIFLKNTAWQRSFYRIHADPLQYNELTYFHAYATRTLFDLQQPDEPDIWTVNRDKTMVYLEIEPGPGDYYRIETVADGSFELRLAGLGLHVYTTGVAILAISVDNYSYPEPEQVLRINEFGRRIYPQFLGTTAPYTQLSRHKVLANCIELRCGKVNDGIPLRENFRQYDHLDGKETHSVEAATGTYVYKQVIDFPKHICGLFPDAFVFGAAWESGGHKIRFNILTDDRMFFQSWYGNDDIAAALKYQPGTVPEASGKAALFKTDASVKEGLYASSGFWYAYQYGDTNPQSPSIKSLAKMSQDLVNNTYSRWVGYGTLYGFTRDSFVVLSESLEKMTGNGIPIVQHLKTMYYQMAVLCLAQRAGVLRFAAEADALAKRAKRADSEPKTLQWIQQLYLNYIEFSNSVCYYEITPQIQGMEIYRQFREVMDVPEQVKNLDEQIKELHDYAMLVEQKRAADKAQRLSIIATIFLPAGVVIGLMGINAFTKEDMKFGEAPTAAWWWITTAIILSALISWLLLSKKTISIFRKNKSER